MLHSVKSCMVSSQVMQKFQALRILKNSHIDAGLDLVEVLEELPAFTAGYAYSLVSNTFVQRADGKLGTKHLMVLGIPQVVNSIRKQGASLAGAIVEAVIQLLTQQIALLSQVRGPILTSVQSAEY